mmetsp:Transcript_46338/g.90483  ORF Transcript_46338/g.90483 Transcript_46338/m.90483 type:complete len:215 (+) Transcript_46338:85-729(+)
MSTMSSELTPAEVRCHTNTSHFSAAFVEGVDTDGGGVGSNAGGLVMSWVQTRGRLEQGSGDAGQDLVARTSRCTPRARRTRPVLRRAASGSGSRSCTGWPTRCWRRSRSSISVREKGKAARPRSSRGVRTSWPSTAARSTVARRPPSSPPGRCSSASTPCCCQTGTTSSAAAACATPRRCGRCRPKRSARGRCDTASGSSPKDPDRRRGSSPWT